ncbi:MAG: alpha/beta fold hydrolase [Rhodospirillales bacterium]|nr:alpha/beta fold hydrolase [Rhodospirillales bacterium]
MTAIPDFKLPPFTQRFPWWGGDLQTLATALIDAPSSLAPATSERVRFPLKGGDTMLAMLDRPATPQAGTPLVLLIHGVPGSEAAPYMLRMSGYLLDKGYPVLRLNMRGAGPSRATCGGQYSAASSRDLAELIGLLPPDLTAAGVAAVGYSVGGAILLKYLGEEGQRTPLCAAASVSAPIDLLGTCLSLLRLRNFLYHRHVFGAVKREALADGAVLTPDERRSIAAARTLYEFDDRFTGPRSGFAGAEDYYFHCSAVNFLPGIRIPTLVLASLDDPWVPGSAYSGHHWGSNKSLSLRPVLTPRGGHVGFHGVGGYKPWSDLAVMKFLEEA